MTLSEYLGADADTLKAMTDEQILAHFEPFLNVTRPERVEKKITPQAAAKNPEFAKNIAQLQKMGINVGHLLYAKKK